MLTISERQSLVERYLPLANKMAWERAKIVRKNVHIDELKSAAYMGLVDAASRHESGEFKPFLRIMGEMEDYLRSLRWGKKKSPVEALSVDPADEDDSNYARFACEDEPGRHLSSADDLGRITRSLDAMAADMVLMYHVQEKNLKQIATKYGLSVGRVCQIIKKSLSSLRDDVEVFEMAA